MAFEVFKELARTRRRNADKVDPGIGRTRVGHRTLKCVLTIGTRSANSIRASGFTAAQTGRTHDRTRPMLQLGQKVLAKAPSTHDRTRPMLQLGQKVLAKAPSTHDPKRTSRCLTRTGQQTIFFAGGYDLLLAPFGVR
jgi:hypothetical protein